MTLFFTSDTHFWHPKVIKYCKRPFLCATHARIPWDDVQPCEVCVDNMNQALIERWNSTVAATDTVVHCGDFAMGPRSNIAPTRAKLNGRIILVKGNHDRSDSAMHEAGFDEVHSRLEMELDGYKLYLSHIPSGPDHFETNRKFDSRLLKPPPAQYDYWLCGHVHEAWRRKGNIINVGVDVSDYQPLTLEELLKRDLPAET